MFSYQQKLDQEIALDNEIQTLMTRALNPTAADITKAAMQFQTKQRQADYHAQFVNPGVNKAASPLP
jgi:hypothetical protein